GTPEEVYDAPATPFVYHFLGRSNSYGDGFVRPHEFEVFTQPGGDLRPGVLKHLRLVGAVARLEVVSTESKDLLEIELPKAQVSALGLREGSTIYYKPQRLEQFAGVGI
ncbi:MAG: sulfate ABC transporter ATP-binding protein, partial [Meiothermus sp.]